MYPLNTGKKIIKDFYPITVMDFLSDSSTGVLEANSFDCSDFLGTKAGKSFHFHPSSAIYWGPVSPS